MKFSRNYLIIILLYVLGINLLIAGTQIKFFDSFYQAESVKKVFALDTLICISGSHCNFQMVVSDTIKNSEIIISGLPENFTIQVYRELLSGMQAKKGDQTKYIYDILLPLDQNNKHQFTLPGLNDEAKTRIKKSALVFWIELFCPEEAKAGQYILEVELESKAAKIKNQLPLRVLKIPRKLRKTILKIDYNEYGDKYLDAYKKKYFQEELLRIEQVYYKFADEHGGTLNVLPYKSQTGQPREGMVPEISKLKKVPEIDNWNDFEQRYSSLFNGSLFADGETIDHFYLPFNPEWPASFELYNTDRARYEEIWRQTAKSMIDFFKKCGWTSTVFQVYMNQKPDEDNKIPWNLDEPKGINDYKALRYYFDLFSSSFKNANPVKVKFRIDISHFYCDEHRGEKNKDFRVNSGEKILEPVEIWVIADHALKSDFAMQEARKLIQNGKEVWHYGATPALNDPPQQIFRHIYRDWQNGITGFMVWRSLNRKLDQGDGDDFIFYDGADFGIEGPVPSRRLKWLRDAQKDFSLLETIKDVDENFLTSLTVNETRSGMQKKMFSRLAGE